MQFVGKVISKVSDFYKDINPSTLSGAIDIIVVKQVDGELVCSPFHVRFGKLSLLRPQEKIVQISVNSKKTDLQMKVGEAGETFFVIESQTPLPLEYLTSPIVPGENEVSDDDFALSDPGTPTMDTIIPEADAAHFSDTEMEYGAIFEEEPVNSQWKADKAAAMITSIPSIMPEIEEGSPVRADDFIRRMKKDPERVLDLLKEKMEMSNCCDVLVQSLEDLEREFEAYKTDELSHLPCAIYRIKSFYFTSEQAIALIMCNNLNSLSVDKVKEILQDYEPISCPEPRASTPRYGKTLRLTSEQLQSLNLRDGENDIAFSVNSGFQGTSTIKAKIFQFDVSDRIVISDIDGTITKSDALGHFFNMVGKDWTHPGVARLYTDISKNGYKFIYLTSRAIGQAKSTRDYIHGVEQGQFCLPAGPVIMSPDRLLTAIRREMIIKRPEQFKIACLRDILRLFRDQQPFYAGFGNRITDAVSYRAVSVPASRIFTISSNGELKLELMDSYKSTYVRLNDLVDHVFPPIEMTREMEFNDFLYWREPIESESESSVSVASVESESESLSDEELLFETIVGE